MTRLGLLGGISFTLLLSAQAAYAQDPVKIELLEVRNHWIGPRHVIHAEVQRPFTGVKLEVTVDAAGNVESARAVEGPEPFFSEAEALELKRKFKPFERDGSPVPASFSDYVSIVPPEQWAETAVPFPEIKDWTSLRMRLKRTTCYGPCPEYSVEVRGDGEVDFEGATNVLAPGHHRGKISKEAVENLLAAFRRANYFSLKDEYVTPVTDNPTYTTSIEFDGNTKSVRDYVGLQAGMPELVEDLEDTIDRIAGTEKWIKGNQETGAALVAEGWNFRAKTEENRALFAKVVASGSPDLVQLFLASGAPALSLTKDGEGPLMSAAANGDFNLVTRMLAGQQRPPRAALSCALGEAARSGNLELVQFLIDKGGDPNGPPCGKFKITTLMKATLSGKPEIVEEILKYHPDVDSRAPDGSTALEFLLSRSPAKPADSQKITRLLLNAGADPNSRDTTGRTPIFDACDTERVDAIRTLVAGGADVNAKNQNGSTPLMSCFSLRSLKTLIELGADLNIRNQFGRTAAEEARQMGALDKAELLEAAMKHESQKK